MGYTLPREWEGRTYTFASRTPCGQPGMASYHCGVKIVSRGAGQSAVASAAYRSGKRLRNAREERVHDYTRRRGVVHEELLLPAEAPEWARSREALWCAVELAERRVDAQLAREFELALPWELSAEARLALVRGWAEEQLVSRGMGVDLAIHEPSRGGDQRNRHAHLLVTLRRLGADGLAAKKEREWNSRELLEAWRASWAEHQNRALERAGSRSRVDHRSLEVQHREAEQRGDPEAWRLEREPTRHLGPAATALERRQQRSDLGDLNREAVRAELGKLLPHALEQTQSMARAGGWAPSVEAFVDRLRAEGVAARGEGEVLRYTRHGVTLEAEELGPAWDRRGVVGGLEDGAREQGRHSAGGGGGAADLAAAGRSADAAGGATEAAERVGRALRAAAEHAAGPARGVRRPRAPGGGAGGAVVDRIRALVERVIEGLRELAAVVARLRPAAPGRRRLALDKRPASAPAVPGASPVPRLPLDQQSYQQRASAHEGAQRQRGDLDQARMTELQALHARCQQAIRQGSSDDPALREELAWRGAVGRVAWRVRNELYELRYGPDSRSVLGPLPWLELYDERCVHELVKRLGEGSPLARVRAERITPEVARRLEAALADYRVGGDEAAMRQTVAAIVRDSSPPSGPVRELADRLLGSRGPSRPRGR
ncbi:MAG: MobQ family relaxase [Candidatus Latescibacterota bacterium]